MHRVSIRTLTLLLVLLAAVISWQYLAKARSPRPGAIWLAGDCDPARETPCTDAAITLDS
jgi:hypothetical protein